MTKHAYYVVDVFADTAFQGVPIAVFPEAEKLPEDKLLPIARELKVSETVFITPSNKGPDYFRQRLFTVHGEIDFGGHPNLATAHVLALVGKVRLNGKNTRVILEQNSADISVNISNQGGKPSFVQFTLECAPVIDRYTPPESELAALLSIEPRDIDTRTFHTRLVSEDFPYLIIPLISQAAVRKARFNLNAWSQSSAPALWAREVLLFSNRTKSVDANFHARLLGPNIGHLDDPPIGSAMPCFAAYLSSHDHIREGTYTFTIDRGTLETRRSLLHIEMDKHAGRPLTLRVGGTSVLVSENSLILDAG